jgi:hemerythrin-like domain-containing protein
MAAMAQKRSRELRPLSSEHHQALLVAFQLKKGLAGHSESAGAPKDMAGLMALARRFEDSVFLAHTKAEEDLLGAYLSAADMKRLQFEHREMVRLLEAARTARGGEARQSLAAFADLLERHIRWEERELFPACEGALGEDVLSTIGHELEKRLVTRAEKAPKRA